MTSLEPMVLAPFDKAANCSSDINKTYLLTSSLPENASAILITALSRSLPFPICSPPYFFRSHAPVVHESMSSILAISFANVTRTFILRGTVRTHTYDPVQLSMDEDTAVGMIVS